MNNLNILFISWYEHVGTSILKSGIVQNSLAMIEDAHENIFILMGGQNHGNFPFDKKITRDVFITKHRSDRLQKLLVLGQKQILWGKKTTSGITY